MAGVGLAGIGSLVFLVFSGIKQPFPNLDDISQDGISQSVSILENPPKIWPDYSAITIPWNMAPLNFEIKENGYSDFMTRISSTSGKSIKCHGRIVQIPQNEWKKLLEENKGNQLSIEIYAVSGKEYFCFQTIKNTISSDPIDPWLSYRLIEPGYEFFWEINLNQRCLESFDEKTFADNMLIDGSTCMNCHSFQDRQTKRYMFHVRNNRPGTIIVDHGHVQKIDLKPEGLLSNCTYPAWHPTENLIAFSVNKTFQSFHILSKNKIEVMDSQSDLVLYDPVQKKVTSILQTPDDMETFPSWSPDGKYLYFCSAHFVSKKGQEQNQEQEYHGVDEDSGKDLASFKRDEFSSRYTEIKYNLMRVSFDIRTRRFGPPEMMVDAGQLDKSIVHPRVSPDGRYLMYAMSKFGTFPIWHPESELHLLDLQTGTSRIMEEVNSRESESYHTWDSSGRWFVFSSRREDGSYTRLYFSHFQDGNATKPFLLPQYDPRQNLKRMKSYNVPELVQEPIHESITQLMEEAKKYRGTPTTFE